MIYLLILFAVLAVLGLAGYFAACSGAGRLLSIKEWIFLRGKK